MRREIFDKQPIKQAYMRQLNDAATIYNSDTSYSIDQNIGINQALGRNQWW